MANFIKRTGATALDIFGNVITGALKGVEGIYDMGAGLVGAVGGIFDKDFQKDVEAHIEKDHVGTFMNDVVNLDDMTRGSYLDDSAAGRMVEGVASGLGQMLPAVAVSWIPGVGPALGLAVTGVSAAGNATEEAFNDGADYTRGMLYGAASGAVEAGTEKLFGGFTKGITGAGLLDDVGKSIAGEIGEVGLRRVAKDAIGEGIEEVAAEIANPALKSIYKGKGAFSEYGDAEYWKGVGEAGIVGAGTALAYGGTVGRALKSSGKYADVASSIESVQNITKKLADIDAAGKLDADIDSVAANTILTNYEQVETALKSVSEKQRADIIKRNNLSAIFEADGSLKESVGAALDRRIDKSGGFRGEYYTVNARGKESVIAEDLEKISAKLNVKEGIKASREGAEAPTSSVRVFSGELTDTGRENLTKTKKALRALNKKGGADVSLIITEDIPGTNGVMVGDRMYITREALENGKYARTLVHEYTHFAEGTREYNDLVSFLSKDSEAFVAAAENVLANNYGITREQIDAISEKIGRGEALTDSENRIRALMLSETNAKMTEAILGSEQFINKLVREDASLAAKIIDKIKSLIEMLKNIGNSAAMAEHRRLVEAEKLYLKAAKAAGNRELIAKILGERSEDEKKKAAEAQQTSEDGVTAPGTDNVTEDANPDQNDKKTPLTNTDSGNMSVSDKVQFALDMDKTYSQMNVEEKGIGDSIAEFVENVNSMTDKTNQTKRKKKIGILSTGHVSKINKIMAVINPDFSAEGYELWMDGTAAVHIERRHGKNGVADTSMSTKKAKALIPWASQNADGGEFILKNDGNIKLSDRFFNRDGTKAPEIKLTKKTSAGNVFISECVPDASNKRVWITSAYINKNGSKGQLLNMETEVPPQPTSKTSSDSNATDISIPDSPEKVNTSDEKIQFSREALNEKQISELQKRGIKGDDLLNAIDLSEEILSVNGEITEDAKAVLYHGTTAENAKKIISTGKMYGKEDNLFFSTKKDGLVLDYGEAVIEAKIPLEKLELNDVFDDEMHLTMRVKPYEMTKIQFSHSDNDIDPANREGSGISARDFERLRKRYENLRTYERKDVNFIVDSVLDTILTSEDETISLPSEKRKNLQDRLLDVLGKPMSESARKKAIADIADRIIYDAVIRDNVDAFSEIRDRDIQTVYTYLNVIRRHGFDLSHIEADIRYRYDTKATGILRTWHKKGHSSIDTVFADLNESLNGLPGFPLNADSEAGMFCEIYDAYLEAKESIKSKVSMKLSEAMTRDEHISLRNDIVNIIIEQSKSLGESSEVAKLVAAATAAVRDSQRQVAIMQQRTKLYYEVEKLRDFDKGRFLNASRVKTNLFDHAISLMKGITRGGNVSVSVIRDIAANLKSFYTKDHPLFLTKNDKGETSDGRSYDIIEKLERLSDGVAVDDKGNPIDVKKLLEPYRHRINLDGVRDVDGREPQKNSRWRAAPDAKDVVTLKQVADALAESGVVIEGSDTAIFDYISKAYNHQQRPLTIQDYRDLTDVVAYFRKYIEQFNRVFRKGKYVEAKPIAERYVALIENNWAVKVGWLRKLMLGIYGKNYFRPQSITKVLDGYESGFFTEMHEEFRQGAINAADYELQMQEGIPEFYEKHKKYFSELPKRTVSYRGKNIPIDVAMSLYMTSKRDHAVAGLAGSGFKYQDGSEAIEFSGYTDANTPEALFGGRQKLQNELYKQFNETDKAFISLCEQMFNERCKQLKNKTDLETQGYSNTIDGYYYPIRRAFVAKGIDSDVADLMDRVSNKSFNKNTVHGAKGVLCIEPLTSTLSRHVKGIAQYAALSSTIRNYDTLYNLNLSDNANDPRTVRREAEKLWKEGGDYMKKLLADIQGVNKEYHPFLSALSGAYATYQLGFNFKTCASQLSSLLAATSIIDADCIIKGFGVKTADVDDYSVVARLRNANNDAIFAQANSNKSGLITDRGTKRGVAEKAMEAFKNFGEKSMFGIGLMDRLVVKRLFAACQYQVQKKGGGKVGTVENKKAAAELLERVILDTQQNAYATERSAAMRGGEISRMFTMFSADAMNVTGQLLDSWGEISTLKTRIRNTEEGNEREALKKRLKAANKKTFRAGTAMLLSGIYMSALALLFNFLYDRELEEDETYVTFMLPNLLGNLVGGLPVIRDIANKYLDGYDAEGYLFSTLNDMADSTKDVFVTSGKALSGQHVENREIFLSLRKLVYASGQLLGIPTRNIYNNLRGLLGHISPETAYRVDDLFYKQSYNKDLAKAIAAGDEGLIATIVGVITGERIGDIKDDKSREVINSLAASGYTVLPRTVGDTITYDGVEYNLNAKQKSKFKAVYSEAHNAVAELVRLPAFTKADEETQADAIMRVYNAYWEIARNEVLNIPETKTTLFARVLDIEELALVIAHASNLKADKDKAGNSISGSKKAKVQKYIESLNLTAAEKYLIMGYLGYKNLYGKEKVTAYLAKYKLSYNEKTQIFKACGY